MPRWARCSGACWNCTASTRSASPGSAGVDLAAIPAPGERIEVDKIDSILGVAIPLASDPAFGLQAARCWHPSELGVLGYAWLSSSTLRTGLERAVRYSRLVGERGITEIEDTRQGLKVRFWAKRGNPAVVPVAAVIVDIVMALLLDLCRMNAGAALRPVAATLRRRKPDPADAYERFFGCAVQFGAEENTFVLSAKDADRPLPSANRQLAATFDKMLAEELARLDKSDVVSRSRAAVLGHLSSGEGTAEDTAKQLHMSPRTLQRKLAEANTTYLQLRRRHAQRPCPALHRGPAPLGHRHYLLARLLPAERVHSRVQALDRRQSKRPPDKMHRALALKWPRRWRAGISAWRQRSSISWPARR